MRNGPKVTEFAALVKPGYMLETPRIRRYWSLRPVTMRSVRTISREVARLKRADPSETKRQGLVRGTGQDMVRPAWRHAEVDRNDRPAESRALSQLRDVRKDPEE
jgi:hypothetical protein